MDSNNTITQLKPSEWLAIGEFKNEVKLNIGDAVHIRLFDDFGDLSELCVQFDISQHEQGEPHVWPKLVAEHINRHFSLLCAGRSYPDYGIVPCYGTNTLYATRSSSIVKAHIQTIHAPASEALNYTHTHAPVYDYIFPQNQANYRAGDKILQPSNGKIYMCRPWPYTDFCRLGNTMNEQYEPGFGKNWQLAWDEVRQKPT